MEIYVFVTVCIITCIYLLRNGPTLAGIIGGYKVWTYIEPPSYKQIQLYDHSGEIPVFFESCIEKMKQSTNNLIVLTPENIQEYLPNFSIQMGENAKYPLKKRIDLLFACILEKYGGLCLSPGTILYKLNDIFSQTYHCDLVSVGGSPSVIQASASNLYPNTYVIGSKQGSSFMKIYKQELLKHINNPPIQSYNILSRLIQLYKPKQYHFGTEYDGTMNKHMKLITVNEYLGNYPIEFLNKNKLYLISFPYDILYNRNEYKWFLNLSEKQFKNSHSQVNKLLHL